MMLFDLVRKLNDEITLNINEGMPGKNFPCLYGVTDGYNAHITFMDQTVWDSSVWKYERDPSVPTDADIAYEIGRIETHIKARVMDHLTRLYNIQW